MAPKEEATHNVIVVGTDLGPAGTEALSEALRLTKMLPQPELHVVYAVSLEGGRDARSLDRTSEELDRAREWLSAHVHEVCEAQGCGAALAEIVLHPRVGRAAACVHQVAIDHDADFIVVGTRSRNSVMRWLEGSVSRELARTAHCPVLIAHPKDYRGLRRTESVAPPRPGQDMDAGREGSELHMPDRSSHFSGML